MDVVGNFLHCVLVFILLNVYFTFSLLFNTFYNDTINMFFYVGMWHITVKNPISYQYTIFLNVPFSRNIWLMGAVYQSVPLFPSTYILLINTVFFIVLMLFGLIIHAKQEYFNN